MSSSNKGKFSERLKKIALFKRKKKTNVDDNGNLKRTLLIPAMIISKSVNKDKDKVKENNNKIEEFDEKKRIEKEERLEQLKNEVDLDEYKEKDLDIKVINNKVNEINVDNKKIKIKDININKIMKLHNKNSKISNKIGLNENDLTLLEKEKLEREIINLIKKNLVKQLNEYEILQSDLFIIKEFCNDNIYYNKCLNNLNDIKKLLTRINSLKEKYKYLKDNTSFDYLFETEDESLEDKIISLKSMLETDNLDYLVKDYKLLEEYKLLYFKIDKIKDDTIKFEEEKNKRVIELKKRDIDFEEFKKKLSNVSSLSDGYSKFVNEQDKFMEELDVKISKIDSYQKTEYNFIAMKLILNKTFNYLKLLLMSPLKGLTPNIAVRTLAARKAIKVMDDILEENTKRYTVYEAIDYSKDIEIAINDLDYTSNLIDNTLGEISSLKEKYKEQFKKYENTFKDYDDAIKKLNKIENSIINNKIKVDIIKNKMIENEKINSDKMERVLELNTKIS